MSSVNNSSDNENENENQNEEEENEINDNNEQGEMEMNNTATEEALYLRFKKDVRLDKLKYLMKVLRMIMMLYVAEFARSAKKVSEFNERWNEESQDGELDLEDMALPDTGANKMPIMLRITFPNITNKSSRNDILKEVKKEVLRRFPFIFESDIMDDQTGVLISELSDKSDGEGESSTSNKDYGLNTGNDSDGEDNDESDEADKDKNY